MRPCRVPNPLVAKLEQHGPLSEPERQTLEAITARTRSYRPHEDIVIEGGTPSHSCLIVEGFAIRHKHLSDGRRQITGFHLPGDFADLHSFLLKPMDDGVGALTSCTVAHVSHDDLKQITKSQPHLTRLLWFTTLVDGAVHRTWMTAVGTLDARERLAHFLCELHDRLKPIGLMTNNAYKLPITQEELGDAFGMSTVHVNRMLQDLRSEGLITTQGKNLAIVDWKRLQKVGQYCPNYLHLGQQVERD